MLDYCPDLYIPFIYFSFPGFTDAVVPGLLRGLGLGHPSDNIMSQSGSPMGDQIPLITEGYFSTVLHISEPGDEDYKLQSASPQIETPSVEGVEEQEEDVVERIMVPPKVTLSTESPVSRKVGTQQLIPKNLAVMSRPKNRHHTTVVTFPVGLELSKSGTESKSRLSAQGTDVAWDEYDSDGDGFALRKNRRNMSYKAAVTTLDAGATPKDSTNTLQPVVQRRAVSPSPSRSPGRKVRVAQ